MHILSKKIAHSMIESLVSSKTKIKLLLRFLLNPKIKAHLRQLAKDFDESTNGIRLELNKLEESKILISAQKGNQKIFQANSSHPLFAEIRSIVLKSSGIQQVIDNIIFKLGDLDLAFISGDYAKGIDSGIIDLVFVAKFINQDELNRVCKKTELLINRKIRFLILTKSEFENLSSRFRNDSILILWENI